MQNARNMPPVDVHSSEQNAFVQDWLSAYPKAFPNPNPGSGDDQNVLFDVVIEAIQETYSPYPKVYTWVLVDRLTGVIQHVEMCDKPPSFENTDDDTTRFVFEGYLNGGDSVEVDEPRHNESRAIRNRRTADWGNED